MRIDVSPVHDYCVVAFRGDGSIKEVLGPMKQASAFAKQGDIIAMADKSEFRKSKVLPAVAMVMTRK